MWEMEIHRGCDCCGLWRGGSAPSGSTRPGNGWAGPGGPNGAQLQELEAIIDLVTASAPLPGRVQEILTVDQHNKLQPLEATSRWRSKGGETFPRLGSYIE